MGGREKKLPNNNLRANAAVPDVGSGLFLSLIPSGLGEQAHEE
jgi:hypothetical protein